MELQSKNISGFFASLLFHELARHTRGYNTRQADQSDLVESYPIGLNLRETLGSNLPDV